MTITRQITNAGAPLIKPDGNILDNVRISFRLVDTNGLATAVWDVNTPNERIVGIVYAKTDDAGIFWETDAAGEYVLVGETKQLVELWPNDRGNIVTQYDCHVFYEGVNDFTAYIETGDLSPLTWYELRTSDLTAQIGNVQGATASIDGEGAVFDGITGKKIKRYSLTGIVKSIAGVFSSAVAGTDYVAPTGSGAGLTGITASQISTTPRNVGKSAFLDPFLAEVDESLTAMKATGFGAWTSGTDAATYSIVGGKFQLDRAGYGYINSRNVAWVAGQQTGVLEANTFYFVYIDAAGLLQSSVSFPAGTIRLFEVLYDGTNYLVGKENHPVEFQSAVSSYLHSAAGTIIFGTGANITRVALGTGAASGDRQIKIVGADVLADHGLNTTVPDSSGAGVTISQMNRNAGGKWIRFANQTELAPYYNLAGTPTLLDATTNIFGVYVIYAKKDDINSSTPQYYATMGESAYSTLAAAQAAITAGTVTYETNELKSMEGAQLGFAIVQYSATGGYITELQIAKSSLSQQFIGAGVGASGNHALQSNLGYAESGHTGFQAALGYTAENIANKVTSLSGASTDVQYPSAKLAYDQLELKALKTRTYTTTSLSTLTLDYSLYDVAKLTAQAVALTIANPTGAFVEDSPLLIELKDNGTARAIAFGDQFVNSGATKPTTTVAGKWMRIACIRNATTSTWDIVAVINEA